MRPIRRSTPPARPRRSFRATRSTSCPRGRSSATCDRQNRGVSFMDTGLTTIPEAAIEKHRATAQSFITRIVVLEDASRDSGTALAGTNRRFVSTVSVGSARRTREVELAKTVAAVHPDDQLLTIPQHTLLFRARRGTAIALAISDV